MSDNGVRIDVVKLRVVVLRLLEKIGFMSTDSEIITDCMLEADLCGVHTHGVAILGAHIKRIIDNGYNMTPVFKVVKETAAFSVIDADNGIGFLSAVHSMQKAINGAKKSGIYTVLSRNANTYGAAFYYAMMASKEGLVGITFSNSPAAMAPWGGKEKLFGTNPFAIAIPALDGEMIIFDMATSKVAKSKINLVKQKGERIPFDWALDANGNPTDDPLEAIKGVVLPMAEHKGYGLALTIDVLAGVLSGAAYLDQVGRFYSEEGKCMNVGQTFIAIDPRIVLGEGFYEVINQYIMRIRKSDSLNKNTIRVPGDGKSNYRQKSLVQGIQLDDPTVKQINHWLEALDINERI